MVHNTGLPVLFCVEKKGLSEMKIAVTYENGLVFQHFGHSSQFKIYEVEANQVVSSAVVDTNGSGHGALAGFLKCKCADMRRYWRRRAPGFTGKRH